MNKVLVFKFREFTDVVMTLPVLYSACLCHKSHEFVLVTKESLVDLFVNPPSNLKVVSVDRSRYHGLKGSLRLWKEMKRKYAPSIVVDLDADFTTRVATMAARVGGTKTSTVTPPHAHARQLTRETNKVMLPLVSARARYREAFFRAGLPIQERFEGIYGHDGHGDPRLFEAVSSPRNADEVWIGIAPFAKYRGKSYPKELVEEVVASLGADVANVKIFLFGGGEEERRILSEWALKYKFAVSPAVARMGFPAELSLLSHLDVMLTMDSANMHLASLVGTKCVTVWGATHPYCGYKGWHQSESMNISLPMPCRPCSLYGDKVCHRGDYHCLTAIKPRVVTDKVKSALSAIKNNQVLNH